MIIPEKFDIANLPTPEQKVKFDGAEFTIKRDDFTGTEFSGNKIRKLEYLLADAVSKKAEKLYTCGGIQSNHARATAFAGVKYGLKSRLYLRGEDTGIYEGNLFLNKFLGAELKFVTQEEYDNIDEIMAQDAQNDSAEVYVIPEGGSNEIGAWGYVDFIKEVFSNKDSNEYSGVLSACGSGGTSAGMLVGSQLNNLDLDIYVINVCNDEEHFRNRIEKIVENMISKYQLGLDIDFSRLKIFDGFSEEGYTNIIDPKLEVIRKLCRETGILLDPVYTGKAFYAYREKFIKTGEAEKILFVHTGGLFGVFARRNEYLK